MQEIHLDHTKLLHIENARRSIESLLEILEKIKSDQTSACYMAENKEIYTDIDTVTQGLKQNTVILLSVNNSIKKQARDVATYKKDDF